jgi:hypothetical protein
MEKSNASSKERRQIVAEELEKFEKLLNGHRKILQAIGSL